MPRQVDRAAAVVIKPARPPSPPRADHPNRALVAWSLRSLVPWSLVFWSAAKPRSAGCGLPASGGLTRPAALAPGTPSASGRDLFAVGSAAQTFPLLTSAGSAVVTTYVALRRFLVAPPSSGCAAQRLLDPLHQPSSEDPHPPSSLAPLSCRTARRSLPSSISQPCDDPEGQTSASSDLPVQPLLLLLSNARN
jgi:hypothetical protein